MAECFSSFIGKRPEQDWALLTALEDFQGFMAMEEGPETPEFFN